MELVIEAMASMDQNFGFDATVYAMGSMLREQRVHETIGGIVTLLWFFGGLFGDVFLYFISMTMSLALFTYSSLVNLLPKYRSYSIIHKGAFRRLFVAVVADWGYTSGKDQGAPTFEFLDSTVVIEDIVSFALIGLFIVWIATKYAEVIDTEGLSFTKTPILFVRGILRGIILVGAFYALLLGKGKIPDDYIPFLLVAFIIEPLIYYFYAISNQSLSTTDMVMGSSRLPSVALRESFMTNLLMLFIIMWLDGQDSSEFQLLRVIYLIGVIFTFYASFDAIKKFNENPLGNGPLGDFLNNGPASLQSMNLGNTLSHMVDADMIFDAGNSTSYALKKGALVVPIEEKKGMIKAMIIGQGSSIIEDNQEKIAQQLDGLTTALIPKRKFKKIKKDLIARKFSEIDLNVRGLPDLDVIQNMVSELGLRMEGWVGSLKKELTKFKLSNYGITESADGTSMVNLPGIRVFEGKGISQVKVGGIRVYETPQVTSVRIGSLVSVVEFPNLSFVSLPGITIMDLGKHGTAIDLFGFKISDKLSAERLKEFKDAFLKQMDVWERGMDSKLGSILAKSSTNASMSLSWNGDFKPMLKSKNSGIGDHPALIPSTFKPDKMLPGKVEALPPAVTENQLKLFEITGFDPSGKTQKTSKKNIGLNLDIGLFSGTKEDHKTESDIDEKLGKINKKIEKLQTSISEEPPKKKYNVGEIHDAEYEIVEDDPDDLDYEIQE